MRITKSLAEGIANILLEKKKEKIAKKRQELKDLVTETIIETIPKNVLEFYKSNKDWVRDSSDFRLQSEGNAMDYTHYRTNENLPSNSGYNFVQVSPVKHRSILKIYSAIGMMESDLNKVRFEVETAIFNLRTFANIEKEFPEAAAYLPKNGTTAIAVNIDKVRNLIK